MTPNKIYAGMADRNVEFFIVEDEEKAIIDGTILNAMQWPYPIVRLLNEAIEREPGVKQFLTELHPDSEHKRRCQFVRCRFGGLDMQPDIKDGVLQAGDYWDCPLRGSCTGEGIVCRPLVYNNVEITALDIRIIKLLATGLTNKSIAKEVQLPEGTFNLLKFRLYDKLGVDTKQQVTIVAFELNLI